MKLYGHKEFVDATEVGRGNYSLMERTVIKLHNLLLRKLSKIPKPTDMKDIAVKYDILTQMYYLYHTTTLLNGKETRALAEFMEYMDNEGNDADEDYKNIVLAADNLYEALGKYEFSPDVKEGEFGVSILT